MKHRAVIPKPPVLKGISILGLLLLTLTCVVRFFDPLIATSILWGGAVCLVPNYVFAWWTYRQQSASLAKELVNGFYRAEAIKFVLTAALFAWVFIQADRIRTELFMTAFIVTQVITWVLSSYIVSVYRR